jgi:hypothetical protein
MKPMKMTVMTKLIIWKKANNMKKTMAKNNGNNNSSNNGIMKAKLQ